MKIKTLCTLALLMLSASLASAQAETRCGGPTLARYINWPMYQFDVCHTGYNPYETQINVNNVSNLVLAWKHPTGDIVQGTPSLVNNVVYFGSNDSKLYAVDARTGALIWSYQTDYIINYSPAVANGIVYFGSGFTTNYIYALNASTGALLWKYQTPSFISSSPTIVDGRLYVGTGGALYALNAKDGTLLWQYATTGSATSPAVVNGLVYFATAPGNAYAVNAVTGSLLWKQVLGGQDVPSSPAVFGGILYVSGPNGNLYALNALTGAVLWSAQGSGGVRFAATPVVANGVVYVGGGNTGDLAPPTFYAYDAKNGTFLWSSLPIEQGGTRSLVVANGLVYAVVTSFSNNELIVFPTNGDNVFWTYPNITITSSPIIANGWVYFGSHDQNLYALHLPN